MRVALDTLLDFAEGANGARMRDQALKLIQRSPGGAIVLPARTLGELFNVDWPGPDAEVLSELGEL